MLILRISAVLILCLLFCPSGFSQDNVLPRQWSSLDGKFSVHGTMVGREGDNVIIETIDRRRLPVEIGKLSLPDQAFVNAKDAAGKPAKKKGKVKTKTNPKTSSAKAIKFPEDEFWQVKADPFISNADIGADSIDFVQDDAHPFKESILISRDRTQLYLFDFPKNDVVQAANVGARGRAVRLRSWDLIGGERIGQDLVLPDCSPVEISPSKRRMMVATSGRSFSSPLIHILEPFDGDVATVATWTPYPRLPAGEKFNFAKFVDDDHVITVSTNGLLGLWDVNRLKLLWHMQIWPDSRPGLSPNGKLLFARVERGLVAIEPLSGKVIGLKSCEAFGMRQLSVNDSCTKVVGVGAGSVREWDIATGELRSDFATASSVINGRVIWLNDNQFLANSSYRAAQGLYDLVDLEAQCSTWIYMFQASPVVSADGRIWCVAPIREAGSKKNVSSIRLPHAEAQEACDEAKKSPLIAFDAGSSDSIPVKFTVSSPLWEKPDLGQEHIQGILEEKGFQVEWAEDETHFSANLANLATDKEKQKQTAITNMSSAVFSVFHGEQMIWRGRRDRTTQRLLRPDDPRKGPPWTDTPFDGLVVPKTFRFYKASLDGSIVTSDEGLIDNEYRRSFDLDGSSEGFSFGTEGSSKQDKKEDDRGSLIGN